MILKFLFGLVLICSCNLQAIYFKNGCIKDIRFKVEDTEYIIKRGESVKVVLTTGVVRFQEYPRFLDQKNGFSGDFSPPRNRKTAVFEPVFYLEEEVRIWNPSPLDLQNIYLAIDVMRPKPPSITDLEARDRAIEYKAKVDSGRNRIEVFDELIRGLSDEDVKCTKKWIDALKW
ncbi:hypothetical protein KAW80_01590 [Candidatus Babeliales bacterium]|nr:hypothetical protein [Candidatus Babeliales bacterium]